MPLDLNDQQGKVPSGKLFGGYEGLSWLSKNSYDPDRAWRSVGAKRQGSLGGGLTYDHVADLTYNPLKYTVLAPSRNLTNPILMGQGGATRPRTGAFTLDMVDWNANIAQLTGDTIGMDRPVLGEASQAAQGGLPSIIADPMRFLTDKDIDVFRNAPARLMDYAFSGAGVVLNRFGVDTGAPDEVDTRYSFQKEGSYWQWLRGSTQDERKQMAKFNADRSIDSSRNAYLRDDVYAAFERDFQTLEGRSSGDANIDWRAKSRFATELEQDYVRENFDGILGKDGLSLVARREVGSLRALISVLLPLPGGTELANLTAPISEEHEAAWNALSNEERKSRLDAATGARMVSDLVTMLPMFSGIGAVVNLAKAGQFANIASKYGASASAAARIGKSAEVTAKLYEYSWRATNGLMAAGLTVATANWAASAISPVWSESLGREIDASRIASRSVLAGVINTTGYFTGFYGIDAAVPAWFRALRRPIRDNLVSQTAGFLKNGINRPIPKPTVDPHPADLQFHREMGGAPVGRILNREYGISQEIQGTALSGEFISMTAGIRQREATEAFKAVRGGGRSGIPEIDRLPNLDDRLNALEAILAQPLKRFHADMVTSIPRAVNARLLDFGVNPGAVAKGLQDKLNRSARTVDDEATQELLSQYGAGYWPSHIVGDGGLEAGAIKYLQAIGAKTTNLAALRREAGKDVLTWQKINRRLHQIAFYKRNAEMYEAAAGSAEADRIGMVSQRTLFSDEVEKLAERLVDPDFAAGQALMRELIDTKDAVQKLDAAGTFKTPEELAAHLIQIGPVLPGRRIVGPSSADGLLNDFQRTLDGEGLWSIGYKPTGKFSLPEGWIDASVPPPPGATRVARTTDDLRADGYRPLAPREVMLGTTFSKREPVWPLAEYGGGVWVREIPGEQLGQAGALSPQGGGGSTNPDLDAFMMAEGEFVDYRDVDAPDPIGEDLVPFLDASGQPEFRHGNNGGADWPVLESTWSKRKWMFKARHGFPIYDLNPARRLSAPTVGKLMHYLGMRTSPEIPFEWEGVKGTAQQLVEGGVDVPLGPNNRSTRPNYLSDYLQQNPEYLETMQENVMTDWLTSQHDSNNGSFMTDGSGDLLGLDKGQAWTYFGKPDEVAAFNDPTGASYWGWRSPTAADPHLGEYLVDWMKDTGVVFDRQAVEAVLLKIEAMPDDVFAAWLRPLGEARAGMGIFEPNADMFIAMMRERKNGLREAVNRGYEHIGGYAIAAPGQPQVFKQGAMGGFHINGSSVDVNSPRVVSGWDTFAEPDIPQGAQLKAGVVIKEWDGKVWVVDSRGQFAGHLATFPKGRVDPADLDTLKFPAGQSPSELDLFKKAATREVEEETGFSVQLTSHLTDYADAKGNVTRYYTAVRTGGGPRYAGFKETENIVLLTPAQAKNRLVRSDSAGAWAPDPEQQEILEAMLSANGIPAAPAAAAAPPPVTPAGADPGMPSDQGLSPDEEFLSYVTLPDGTVFHSPWLDYPMSIPSNIEMGNRGVFMQKFDDVFRGWRTYRLAESQRAMMHRRLSRFGVGLTPAKIDKLHSKIIEMASEYRVPPQAFTLAPKMLPFTAKAYADLGTAIEEIIGKGPYLSRTGEALNIDWRREIAQSYQTALKLNLTAGMTSRMYTLGGPGAGAAWVSHLVYPTFRFALSPGFKAGEHVESWALNAMRGLNPFGGDPFTEQLMLEAGVGHSRGQMRTEAMNEPMIQGAGNGAFEVIDPSATDYRGLFLRAPIGPGTINAARRRMDAANQPQASLMDSIFNRAPDPDVYPSTYSDNTPEVLMPHHTDANGSIIIDEDGRINDDRILGERFETWLGEIVGNSLSEDAAIGLHRFGAGMAFIESLGDDFIDRLAEAITPMHYSSSRQGTAAIVMLRKSLEDGTQPLAGPPGRGRSDIEGAEIMGEAAASQLTKPTMNVSSGERVYGHADAVYAGFGVWQGNQNGAGLILRNSSWKKSVITTRDRMELFGTGPSDIVDDLLTPAGAHRAIRQQLLETLHGIGTGRVVTPKVGKLLDAADLSGLSLDGFTAMRPIETAIPGGAGWDEIEAIILDPKEVAEWIDLVATYGDQVPALRDIKVVPTVSGEVDTALTRYWFEKAGLTDRALIDHPERFMKADVGAYARFIPDELVTPATAPRIIGALLEVRGGSLLSAAGVNAGADAGLSGAEEVRYAIANNFEDDLRRSIADHRKTHPARLASMERYQTHPGYQTTDMAYAEKGVLDSAERIEQHSQLLADVVEWRASAIGNAFDDVRVARAALGGPRNDDAVAWLAGWHELFTVRYLADPSAGGLDRSWTTRSSPRGTGAQKSPVPGDTDISEWAFSRRQSGVFDRATGEMDTDLPPVGDPSMVGSADAQTVSYAKYLLAKYREASFDGYRAGTNTTWEPMIFASPETGPKFAKFMVDDLRSQLRERAIVKTGKAEPGQPIINVWVRGDRQTLVDDRVGGEIVISVIGTDGRPYGGLSLDEISEVWRDKSFPRLQSDMYKSESARTTMNTFGFEGAWSPEGGPNGSIVSYSQSSHLVKGTGDKLVIATDRTGFGYASDPSLPPERYLPVRIAYAFTPEGNKDFMNLTASRGSGYGSDYSFSATAKVKVLDQLLMPFFDGATKQRGTRITYSPFSDPYMRPEWDYYHADGGGFRDVQVPKAAVTSVRSADAMIDDLLVRMELEPALRLDIGSGNDVFIKQLRVRMLRGEIPDGWVARKAGPGWDDAGTPSAETFRQAIDDDEWLRLAGASQEVIDLTAAPPPSGPEDIVGGPEHLTASLERRWQDEIKKATGAAKAKLKAGFDAYWNPIPGKERQQDKLIQSIVRRWYPEMLQQQIPDMYKFLRETVGVGDHQMVDYLLEDRKLLQRWITSESRTDFDKLVMHAEKYKPGDTRAELDSLYSKPEWNDMMEVFRQTQKMASDEAFGVHFFAPHRSSFERSINHPLLGVYPASWAYKVAKEWFRFLYNNDMIEGFRLGMAPAQYIANLQRQQQIAFAQSSDTSLEKWYEEGPLGSTIFMFNLLLPGDWSALPFPLSRSIRDGLRGQLDPGTHLRNNLLGMGMGRDLRIGGEIINEWGSLIGGKPPPLRQGEKRVDEYVRR